MNDRVAYRFNKEDKVYEEVPFLDLEEGDVFMLCEANGLPAANRNGGVACVACEDARTSEGGLWSIKATQYLPPGKLANYPRCHEEVTCEKS